MSPFCAPGQYRNPRAATAQFVIRLTPTQKNRRHTHSSTHDCWSSKLKRLSAANRQGITGGLVSNSMNSITQTAKGALIAGGSYYLIHAHIANRTHLISTSLQDLSYQFNILSNPEDRAQINQLLLHPTPFQTQPLSERIKLNWNRSIINLTQKAHRFNLNDSTDRLILFLKSKLVSVDSNNQT
ncbi:hypothetical protein MJO29_007190 [Puccinia striiformis f. sp. tritici]|uniref:hypothetical protein n=1 Tax=Puccinia striiformis f. sp. tritici TaxID=168172 RepID=UPI000A12A390|nr:hypothetical protein Pst134EA_013321 [Puccinia striiformis f. sp. tritici]KAH9465437.1 hypothetical protein Pst134EA_013321 [Puccinia striiformis f. sp. tritici]KAI7955791.1 hypothetical protein MJO29_007190 [Puccinia striiformis f. sp. tritici]KAI9603727.1 hypothetical protein H4Q26_003326 [Puccinia striiformis f. sp. tritici PST-130]